MLVRHLGPAMVAAMLAAVTAGPATARPGGSSTASPVLTGTAGLVGGYYTVTGAGFAPGAVVPLEIAEADGCCIALNMVADAVGGFSYTGEVWAPGTYRVRALVQRNGSGRWRVAASWSFEAYYP
jgi:hypothetical protein